MTEDTKDLIDIGHLADSIESTADWRRRKAVEFPEDAERNESAARELDRLAKEVRLLDGTDLHREYDIACRKRPDWIIETESQFIREVGFSRWHENGEELARDIIEHAMR